MLNGQEVRALREELRMDSQQFAKLLDVDMRTVQRWEAGSARPTGAAEAVLLGIREKIRRDPSASEQVIQFVVTAAAIGGLAYLLIKLLDLVTEKKAGE